jgi:hypothetical protein|tara:strand:+ start:229 stop:504 length:276 start_codon:yes stop_codon:yes gene_type:complete
MKRDEETDKPTEIIDTTVKHHLMDILDATTPKDKAVEASEKRKRYNLATKIWETEGEIELSIDEAKMIKDRVDEVSNNYFLGLMYDILGEE